MERKMEENKQPKFEGWRDTNIDDNISLGGIVQLLNIFNQRLILIEDQLKVKVGNEEEHTEMTLTQYWIEIQKQEYLKHLKNPNLLYRYNNRIFQGNFCLKTIYHTVSSCLP